jgi:DNA repair exonuclease SbcCD nuclease subunit
MVRFIHSADWQIGRAFASVEGDAAARLRQARTDVIDSIGQIAVNEQAAFVLVAGDVFDAEMLANTTLLAPLERMRRFPDVTWHLLPGNHDPDRREGIWDRLARLGLPDNVKLARQAEPISLGDEAMLLPCPLMARAVSDDPTEWLDSAGTPEGVIRLGLAHGSIRDFGNSEAGLRAPLAPDRAAKAGLDYLALGDWHRAQEINARTWYAGTPEPDRFGDPGKTIAGQVLSVAIAGPGATPTVSPIHSGQFHWATLAAELHETADIDALESQVRGLIDDPARLYVRLQASGALSLADRNLFDRRIGEGLRAAVLALEVSDEALMPEPNTDDLDAIDQPGGMLRVAAERLAESASSADANPEDAATARRALAMLFGYAQAGSGA